MLNVILDQEMDEIYGDLIYGCIMIYNLELYVELIQNKTLVEISDPRAMFSKKLCDFETKWLAKTQKSNLKPNSRNTHEIRTQTQSPMSPHQKNNELFVVPTTTNSDVISVDDDDIRDTVEEFRASTLRSSKRISNKKKKSLTNDL